MKFLSMSSVRLHQVIYQILTLFNLPLKFLLEIRSLEVRIRLFIPMNSDLSILNCKSFIPRVVGLRETFIVLAWREAHILVILMNCSQWLVSIIALHEGVLLNRLMSDGYLILDVVSWTQGSRITNFDVIFLKVISVATSIVRIRRSGSLMDGLKILTVSLAA